MFEVSSRSRHASWTLIGVKEVGTRIKMNVLRVEKGISIAELRSFACPDE
jgi:hypothetical protein